MANYERGVYEPPSDDIRVFDGAEDDELDEEGSRLPLLIVIALLVLAAFGGVVWLAYTQGVQRGRTDAPRIIAAAAGPAKTLPDNAGGETTPYKGLKIYEQPAPADDEASEDTDTAPPPPTAIDAAPKPQAAPVKTPAIAIPALRPQQTTETASTETQSAHIVTPKAAVPQVPGPATAPPRPLLVPHLTAPPVHHTVASAKAAAPAAAPATAPAAGGAFVLQIGAYKSQGEADSAWHAYQTKHPITGGYNSDVKQVDLGDKGVWYRLRIGSFADKDAAAAFCDKLKGDGASCFPTKP